MSFVQAGFLIASAAVAIPVLVHLLSRWQVRRIELGTMRFLQEVIQEASHGRRIRRWLLLLTRMALAALLAFLFARPYFPERANRDGDRLRIVLIDRSASMGMPGKNGRLIDDAVAAASASNSNLGSDAKILWAWFDRHVDPMTESTTRPSAPSSVIGDTNYFAALGWARDKVNGFPNAIADVVMVTDLQQSGLAFGMLAAESLEFPVDVPVRIIDVGRPAANNLAITNVSAEAKRLQPGSDVLISVTLFNYGTLPLEDVPLTASALDGTRNVRLKKSIQIPGGQAQEISFDFGELDPAIWQITISADVDDDLAADNRRFTALEIAKPIPVLVIDSGSSNDGVAAESYYLVTALQQGNRPRLFDDRRTSQDAGGRGRFRTDISYLDDGASRPFGAGTHPLLVVADAAAISAGMIEQVENYVRRGGKLLVFAGDGGGEQLSKQWRQAGLAPGELGTPVRSGTMPFRIASVSAQTTMLELFADPQHGDLGRLAFEKILPVAAESSTKILASFDHGRPAVTQHELGQGRVVWFLSSVDASWGNWTTSPLYLPFVQQMAADLLNLTGEGPIRFRWIGDQRLTARGETIRSEKTSVNTVAFGEESASAAVTFDRPGFDPREGALYIVNGASKESDPTRMDASALAEHFGVTAAGGGKTVVSANITSERRRELWPWLAAAVFVLLVAEFGLANRTPA
jgi:hypothetical protein